MRAEEIFVTLLFSDIVGFTPKCEQLNPSQILDLLNEYFDVMTLILKNNDAMIDKFIGDGIMALYIEQDEKSRRTCAYQAVRSGIEMIEALTPFNTDREEEIQIRVGINSGVVIMGDIGSRFYRRDYTVIGDNVNVAQRLEGVAPHDSVLIGQSTYNLIGDVVKVEKLAPLSLKGKQEQVTAYQVLELYPIDNTL